MMTRLHNFLRRAFAIYFDVAMYTGIAAVPIMIVIEIAIPPGDCLFC